MEPSKYPGCSGTRNLHDNLSDLKAQVAANHKVRACLVLSLPSLPLSIHLLIVLDLNSIEFNYTGENRDVCPVIGR